MKELESSKDIVCFLHDFLVSFMVADIPLDDQIFAYFPDELVWRVYDLINRHVDFGSLNDTDVFVDFGND